MSNKLFSRLPPLPKPLKLLAVALLIVACEPFAPPWGTCEMPPDCDQLDYRISAATGYYYDRSGDVTLIDSLPLSIYVNGTRTTPVAFQPGGGGRAYALSCEGCTGYFDSVSMGFSTDIVTKSGDTVRAGYNLSIGPLPVGIYAGGNGYIRIDSVSGFEDSVFEVRFAGKIAGVWKYDTLGLTIRNPDLILR